MFGLNEGRQLLRWSEFLCAGSGSNSTKLLFKDVEIICFKFMY